MAAFTVTIPDADMSRVTLALCDMSQAAPSVANGITAMEDLLVRITKDYETKQRAAFVPPVPPDPQVSVIAVIPGPTPLL